MVGGDPILDYVLTKADSYPFAEERRLFYVAVTRARKSTVVLYDERFPSVFVNEFIGGESADKTDGEGLYKNSGKVWTKGEDALLRAMFEEGKSIRVISRKMGRSQTSIVMRLGKLGIM